MIKWLDICKNALYIKRLQLYNICYVYINTHVYYRYEMENMDWQLNTKEHWHLLHKNSWPSGTLMLPVWTSICKDVTKGYSSGIYFWISTTINGTFLRETVITRFLPFHWNKFDKTLSVSLSQHVNTES